MEERRTVFISHANPEDNDFASWLGSRLVNAGYDVWTDVLSLVGGKMISPVIGDVIRGRAAIVLVGLSRASHRKEGVLNEITLASTVGRRLGNPGFILPVVLDDLPHVEFPDDLVRRLSIDFSRDWADGLSDVLAALREAGTPRAEERADLAMAAWLAFKARGSAMRKDKPDLLYSNWFRLGALPPLIRFSRFLHGSNIEGAFKQFQSPAQRFNRLAISFADAPTLTAEAPGVRLESAYEVGLDDFLAGRREEGVPQVFRRDARNIVTALLNGAWNRLAESRGLLRREFVAGEAWFVPLGLFDKDRGVFRDDGGTHWRQLAGHSEARRVYWHFGVSARAAIAEPCYVALRSHVVFSEDGQTPIEGPRAVRLRRSFCKSWWNPRWRDMIRAFVASLAGDADQVELPLSRESVAFMAAGPMRFKASVWVDDDEAVPSARDAELEENDGTDFDAVDEKEGW